jgi:hypothetical protein
MMSESVAVPQPRPVPSPQIAPVPQPEPQRYDALESASLYTMPAPAAQPDEARAAGADDKPFWKIWSRN